MRCCAAMGRNPPGPASPPSHRCGFIRFRTGFTMRSSATCCGRSDSVICDGAGTTRGAISSGRHQRDAGAGAVCGALLHRRHGLVAQADPRRHAGGRLLDDPGWARTRRVRGCALGRADRALPPIGAVGRHHVPARRAHPGPLRPLLRSRPDGVVNDRFATRLSAPRGPGLQPPGEHYDFLTPEYLSFNERQSPAQRRAAGGWQHPRVAARLPARARRLTRASCRPKAAGSLSGTLRGASETGR